MTEYVFDIETDTADLHEVSVIWIVCLTDVATREQHVFLPFRGEIGFIELLKNANVVIGHNISKYDCLVFEKLLGFRLPKSVKIRDTLILSQVLNYKRFGNNGHSLAAWGEFFGDYKIEHEDWSQYSEDMLRRCIQDVNLNVKVYEYLMKEYKALAAKAPYLTEYILAEHAATRWHGQCEMYGWPFDKEAALKLQEEMTIRVNSLISKLEPVLGIKAVGKDVVHGFDIGKEPRYLKNGTYDGHLAKWFNIDPRQPWEEDLDEWRSRLVDGAYCRVEFKHLSLSSVADVKTFLFRNGWQPTEWNRKWVDGQEIKTSPKISEDSLELLGGDGKLYADYTVVSSRLSILTNWLNNLDENDRLHGDYISIGTPSMRSRHKVIVNVPDPKSMYGKEMRSLFISQPGYTIVGIDSTGNQARGLAHYLGEENLELAAKSLYNDDIHTFNAKIQERILKEKFNMDVEVKRGMGKINLYAFLFGASGGKLWSTIFGVFDTERGNVLKTEFAKAIPGLHDLMKKLKAIFFKTSRAGEGYIPSIAGNRLYVDSMHKLLVYLLQGLEKITTATALRLTVERLEEEGIEFIPLIFYHDEIDMLVRDEDAERVKEIGKVAFTDAPKLYGIEIMLGSAVSGKSWYEVH